MFELHDSKGGFFRVNLLDDRGNETSAKGVDIKLTSSDESVAKAEPNFDKPYLRVKVTPSGKLGQVDLTLVISDDNPDDDNQNVTLEGVLQLTIVGGPPKTISFIPEETFDLPV